MKSLKNLGKINWVIGVLFQFLLLPLSVLCSYWKGFIFHSTNTYRLFTKWRGCHRYFFPPKTERNLNFQQPLKPKGFSGGCFLEGARESFHIYSDFSPKIVNILFFFNPQLPISLLFNFTSWDFEKMSLN